MGACLGGSQLNGEDSQLRHTLPRTLLTAALILLLSGMATAQETAAVPAVDTAAASQDTLLARTARAVLAVLAAYDQARLDLDADAYAQLHAPDAVQCMASGSDPRLWRIAAFSPVGRPQTKALIERAFADPAEVLSGYSNTAVRVDVATDAVLVVRRITETYQDRTTGVERRVDGDHSAHFLVNTDGEWKIQTTISGLGNPDFARTPPVVPAR